MTIKIKNRYETGSHRQKGMVATLLAIIVLVATLLAAVALMRSIDTSTTIAGSLAFRQNVIQEAERAFIDARTLLNSNGFASLNGSQTDAPNIGYYAELQPLVAANRGIPTLLVTQASSTALIAGVKPLTPTTSTANSVYYVLERLCPNSGPADATTCVVPTATNTAGSLANLNSGIVAPMPASAFRLTVLVKGQKNTLGYVQTVVL